MVVWNVPLSHLVIKTLKPDKAERRGVSFFNGILAISKLIITQILKNTKFMAKVEVKKIIDGDTFQGDDNRFYRLADIDTPEKREEGYKKAKEVLSKFIKDEKLIIQEQGTSYGRAELSKGIWPMPPV